MKTYIVAILLSLVLSACAAEGQKTLESRQVLEKITLYSADGAVIKQFDTKESYIRSNNGVVYLITTDGKEYYINGTYIVEELKQ